jgi:hypothetical protein
MRITQEVEVEIDVDDVLCNMDDEQLAKAGLMSVDKAPASAWHRVRVAMRCGDTRELHDLLSRMAWDQAGVILPVGIPVTH